MEKLLEAAMGDSSGSVSVDVERIYFGGKVRARIPRFLIDSFPSIWGGRIRAGRLAMLDLCWSSFAGFLFALFVWLMRRRLGSGAWSC